MRKYKGKIVRGTKPRFIKKSHEELVTLLESLYKVRQKYYSDCALIYKEMKQVGINEGDYQFRENIFARCRVDPISGAKEVTPERNNDDVYVSFYREVIE